MPHPPRPPERRPLVLALLALLVAGSAVLAHLASQGHRLHDPVAGLRQLDLLFLDEPAPLLDRVGGLPGSGALVLVVCEACEPPQLRPDVAAEVRVTGDQEVARAYALALHDDGGGGAARIGPGYALIDDRGRVRYRTFDPGVSGNGEEIRVLVRALSGGRR